MRIFHHEFMILPDERKSDKRFNTNIYKLFALSYLKNQKGYNVVGIATLFQLLL